MSVRSGFESDEKSSYRVALAGRTRLLHLFPSGPIGTPEKQVFNQIYDTLVRVGSELEVQSGLASFRWDESSLLLRLEWAERFFHDQRLIHSEDVIECIRASAPKFSTSVPSSVLWFGDSLRAAGPRAIEITNLSREESIRVLRMLALPDFGIHKSTDQRTIVGSGPYRIEEFTDGLISLVPFELHPQQERALSHLEFVGVPLAYCSAEFQQGRIDEYFYFGVPNKPDVPGSPIRLPSFRANLGLLLLNASQGIFRSHPARREFASLYARAVCDGAFDDSWSLPNSLIPPGFDGNGIVDYLQIRSEPQDARLSGAIRVGVTNSRQADRLRKVFAHSCFEGFAITFHEFTGYDTLKLAGMAGVIDCAFLAIRCDRSDPAEFFEFLDPSHPTALFGELDPVASPAYSRVGEIGVEALERILFERMICLPVGYYYDVRVVSAKGRLVAGLTSHDGPPRYLVASSGDVLREVHRTQQALQAFWEQFSKRRVEQSLLSQMSRTAHDLKSPIGALKLVASDAGLAPELREVLGLAIERMNRIVDASLDSEPRQVRINPYALVEEAVREVSTYSERGILFDIRDFDRLTQVSVPKCDLQSIVTNLVKNSSEALTNKGPDGRIEIGVKSVSPLVLDVVDNGPGFSEEALASFGRKMLSSKPGGNGLGLLQARDALASIGGVLTISNRESGGARVRVQIPSTSIREKEAPYA